MWDAHQGNTVIVPSLKAVSSQQVAYGSGLCRSGKFFQPTRMSKHVDIFSSIHIPRYMMLKNNIKTAAAFLAGTSLYMSYAVSIMLN
jgi:hypothetical protein